jgi:ribosomal protein S18 acetylase RimI-like enzyme
MQYTSRPYQSKKDMHDIGRLIRRAYAKRKYFNAWSFCRYDIWSQRRIADAVSFDDDLWQKTFKLVYDKNRTLLGAAFCSVWLDGENNIAEFELVGALPQFQKQGLAGALMVHACNRLREMNCSQADVASWSESTGANKLYSAAGFLEQDRLYSWRNDPRK